MSSLITKGNASGTGSVTLESPNTNSDFTISLPATTGTVVLAGTTPSLNGVTFPATQSASTDANTLDDYEEGTWTATIGNFTLNTGTFTFTARYTKIGRQVTLNFLQAATGTISWSAGNYLAGLPFTPTTEGGTAGVYTNSSTAISGSVLPWVDNAIYFTGSGSSQNRLTFSVTYFTS
jgi:hypothetical protein